MPSRRSVLALLGIAPVAAPASIALASAPGPASVTAGADVTAHGVTVVPHAWLDAHLIPDAAALGELCRRLRWERLRRKSAPSAPEAA